MLKKHKFPKIRNIRFYLNNPIISLKKLYYKNELVMGFLEFIQCGLSKSNVNLGQKEMLSYITSRNMRRTLVPSDFLKDNITLKQKINYNFSSKKETISLVPFNFQQIKKLSVYPVFLKILNFHSKTMLLGNLVSKEFTKKESQKEVELSWGGPETYKLITFIKNFDEVMEKNPEVLVFFSAYWCQHCHQLKKPYGNAALMAKAANLPVLFATFDITVDPDLAFEKGVVGIPMIKYYKQGKYFSTFRGKRTAEELFEYVKDPPPSPLENKPLDI